jgi:hypothetical protein
MKYGVGSPFPRGTFFGCCASAITPTASNTTAARIDDHPTLFIAHLVSSVIYHADRDKGKCDLHGGRRQVLVDWEKTQFCLSVSWMLRKICSMEKTIQSQLHFITLSARASTFGGIVRPICFAAFRLMTNSNFLGCSTGMSAGFVPFRILST